MAGGDRRARPRGTCSDLSEQIRPREEKEQIPITTQLLQSSGATRSVASTSILLHPGVTGKSVQVQCTLEETNC